MIDYGCINKFVSYKMARCQNRPFPQKNALLLWRRIAILCLLVFFGTQESSAAASSEVAALKSQVQDLLKRIDALEKKQQKSDDLAVPSHLRDSEKKEIPSNPAVTRRTDNPLSLKISGHVNRGILIADNGVNGNPVHVDNDNSPSRLTITGSGQWNETTEVGATVEFGIERNSTDRIDVNDVNDPARSPTIRIAELFLKSKTLGQLYVGYGSTASDGTMENPDLSKTTLLSAGGAFSFLAGATVFTDALTSKKVSIDGQSATADRVLDAGDGLFRQNRIRYNTPAFAGVSLQGSHYFDNKDNNWDLAVKFGRIIHNIKIRAEAAFLQRNTSTRNITGKENAQAKYRQFNTSAGVLFPCGISLFAGYIDRDWDAHDKDGKFVDVNKGKSYTGKIGWQHQFFEAGITAFAVDYGRFSGMIYDTQNPRDLYVGRGVGVFAVQFLDRIATELYVGYRQFMLEGPTDQYNDIKAVLMGARVKF